MPLNATSMTTTYNARTCIPPLHHKPHRPLQCKPTSCPQRSPRDLPQPLLRSIDGATQAGGEPSGCNTAILRTA